MGREQFKTPDADVAAEFDRVCQLFQLALGKPSDRVLFDSLMSEANEKGLNWIQGLEYVVQQREADRTGDASEIADITEIDAGRRQGPVFSMRGVSAESAGDLRRAG
jgi:hypothetical protein